MNDINRLVPGMSFAIKKGLGVRDQEPEVGDLGSGTRDQESEARGQGSDEVKG